MRHLWLGTNPVKNMRKVGVTDDNSKINRGKTYLKIYVRFVRNRYLVIRIPLPDPLVLSSSPDHVVQNIIEGDFRPHDNEHEQKCGLCFVPLATDPVLLPHQCRLDGQYGFLVQISGVRRYKSGCGLCGRFHRRKPSAVCGCDQKLVGY